MRILKAWLVVIFVLGVITYSSVVFGYAVDTDLIVTERGKLLDNTKNGVIVSDEVLEVIQENFDEQNKLLNDCIAEDRIKYCSCTRDIEDTVDSTVLVNDNGTSKVLPLGDESTLIKKGYSLLWLGVGIILFFTLLYLIITIGNRRKRGW